MSATLADAIQSLDDTNTTVSLLRDTVEKKQAAIDTKVDNAITEMNSEVDDAKSSMLIIATDGYRKAVEAATGGRNTVLYDEQGNPNIMVVIPRFTYDEIGMTSTMGTGTVTAFLKDGQELPEIFLSKYLASASNALSLPDMDPRNSINFDEAKSACTAKGAGWHLMNAHEWAALSLWCLANGFQPRGNSQYGRSHDAYHEFGCRGDGLAPNDRSGSARTNTGTGPNSWAHDNTDAGVYDLVGNVWEWRDLMKLVDGQLICTADNNPDLPEASWLAQSVYFDSSTAGDNAGSDNLGSPIIASRVNNSAGPTGDDSHLDYNHRGDWKNTALAEGYSSVELAKRLLIEPAGQDIQGGLWVRNYGTRFPICGGHWSGGSHCGLAALDLHNSRSDRSSGLGFRPAFVA